MNTKSYKHKISFQFQKPVNLYAVPAGRYRATMESVTSCDHDGRHDDIKFLFELTANEDGPVDYRARKVFCREKMNHAQMQDLFKGFYSEGLIEIMIRNGTEIDLNELVGKQVDLLIKTKCVSGWETPYSEIDGTYPVGTLLPEELCDVETVHVI